MANDKVLYDLVVVGASAGGIQALSTLVATLPVGFPAPLVIAQHLGANRPSHLAEILQRQCALPVRTLADDAPQPLDPGVVYVVPADRDVVIRDHLVHLRADSTPGARHAKPSINLLLSSAARAHGERLIAVILTGTGSDGALGAREVKAAGGMVIIQNPGTAEFPAMPASLAPTTVDVVADLERIGPLLTDLLHGVSLPLQPEQTDALQALLAQVRTHSGIEFASYKRPTIVRRLQRRLLATNMPTVADYTQYLASHPDEYQRLIASFLINVTEFFRDPALFKLLREQVLPELVAFALTHGAPLRLWSAGCATGEEAYSLAILVAEALGAELEQVSVQVFATDLDPDAIAFARRGIYPAAALAALPEELIARAFIARDGEYEVNKRIRSLTVFGVHDLGQRAAFPQIDLVLCRNVLIYFTPELQQRVLQLFAYSLREGGYLALGTSETTGPAAELFTPLDPHVRLYRRHGPRTPMPAPQANTVLPLLAPPSVPGHLGVTAAPPPLSAAPLHGAGRLRPHPAIERLAELLLDLSVGVVVVDRHYDIHAINPAAHQLLGIIRPALGEDLIHLAERVPSVPLRGVLDAALRPGAPPVTTQVVTMETVLGERLDLQLACYPPASNSRETPAEQVVLLVTDVTHTAEAHGPPVGAQQPAQRDHPRAGTQGQTKALRRVEEENARLHAQVEQMSALNRTLLEANQEQTTTILGLRERYEELVVGHEEEQASVEEIKTLNEELQASNEELVTVNEELEATVEELSNTNVELQARTLELQRMTTARDTQHQVVEDARAREGAARDVAQQLDHIFAMASHDIRTPLTTLSSNLEMARFRVRRLMAVLRSHGKQDEDLAAPLLAALDNAGASSQRVLSLVMLLVDIASARAGALTLTLAPCDLGVLVRAQVAAQQAVAPNRAILLDLPDQPVLVMADADRLEQVLTNYLTNALKYSPDDQPVVVRLEVTEGKAAVSVQDHGPGLPIDEQSRVWDLFHRAPGVAVQSRVVGSRKSLGLGLNICKRLIELHPGGQVGVESVVGEGSTFWFRLPLAAEAGAIAHTGA